MGDQLSNLDRFIIYLLLSLLSLYLITCLLMVVRIIKLEKQNRRFPAVFSSALRFHIDHLKIVLIAWFIGGAIFWFLLIIVFPILGLICYLTGIKPPPDGGAFIDWTALGVQIIAQTGGYIYAIIRTNKGEDIF